MIEIIYGDIGAGKTLYAVWCSYLYMKQGYYIFSNFPITWSYVFSAKAFTEYVFPPKSLIIIDEAQVWFLNRQWKDIPKTAIIRFTQSRKFGWDFILTTQRLESVDILIREIANMFLYMRRWSFITLIRYHSSPVVKKRYDLGWNFFFPHFLSFLFKHYDTRYVITPDANFTIKPSYEFLKEKEQYDLKRDLGKEYSAKIGRELLYEYKSLKDTEQKSKNLEFTYMPLRVREEEKKHEKKFHFTYED